jgi:hypothetical protein
LLRREACLGNRLQNGVGTRLAERGIQAAELINMARLRAGASESLSAQLRRTRDGLMERDLD